MGGLWTRYHTIVMGVLVASFAGVTLWKYAPTLAPGGGTAGSPATASDSIQNASSFWDPYRNATDARAGGEYDRATDLYRRALQKRPHHSDARFYLGSALAQSGHLREAEKTWRALLADEPESARVRGQLAGLYLCSEIPEQRDLKAAKAHLRAVIRQHGTETQPVVRLAQILVLQDSLTKAEDVLASIAARDRQPPAASFLRGYLAWRAGRSREATIRSAGAHQTLRRRESANDRTEMFPVPPTRRNEACRTITDWRTLLAKSDSTRGSTDPSEGASVYARFDRRLESSRP